MFERAGQVNATFAGGSPRQAEIVAALHELGLTEEEINVIGRVDAGHWQAPVARPGFLTRLRARFGATPAAAGTPPPSDLLILVHLRQSEALAEPVQEVFRRFGATRVSYYPPGQVPARAFGDPDAAPDGDAARFRAAFPEGERKGRAPDAPASRDAEGTS